MLNIHLNARSLSVFASKLESKIYVSVIKLAHSTREYISLSKLVHAIKLIVEDPNIFIRYRRIQVHLDERWIPRNPDPRNLKGIREISPYLYISLITPYT